MKRIFRNISLFIIVSLLFCTFSYSDEEIKKIDNQLKDIKNLYESGVYDEEAYNEYKTRLINKKQKLIGILFRILAFSCSPILFLNFLRRKFKKFLKPKKY